MRLSVVGPPTVTGESSAEGSVVDLWIVGGKLVDPLSSPAVTGTKVVLARLEQLSPLPALSLVESSGGSSPLARMEGRRRDESDSSSVRKHPLLLPLDLDDSCSKS